MATMLVGSSAEDILQKSTSQVVFVVVALDGQGWLEA